MQRALVDDDAWWYDSPPPRAFYLTVKQFKLRF
jgi:hypothetical protein